MDREMRTSANVRWLAVTAWCLIVLAYLAFFMTDLRLDFEQVQRPCRGEGCNFLAVSEAEFAALAAWGLSPLIYSILVNGATVLAVTLSLALGAFILWQQGAARTGWFVSLALILIPITMISDSANLSVIHPIWSLISAVLGEIGLMIFLLFFYLFPNGRFYPRWAYIPYAVALVAFTVWSWEGSVINTLPDWGMAVWFVVITGLLLLAGGFQILRYRRISTPLERQQTKWVLLGLLALITGFPVWFIFFGGVIEFPAGQARLLASILGWWANMLITLMLPASMAIAILRYRLYDIDFLIRRTLQYSLVMALLALVYFGSVVLLQSLFTAVSGQQSPAALVLSTLAIAALFNPLRRRIQDFIDRRFYRQKYDAEKALAEFAAAARSEADLAMLSARLTGTVQETLQPELASLWLVKAGKRP